MPVDDIYWNSIDFGSEDESVHDSSVKHYVDPWDLENYAYIREHLDSIDLESEPGTDFTTEATSTTSHRYAPVQEQNYAAIEEVREYDRPRARSRNRHVSVDVGYRDGFDSEFDENPYEVNLKDVSLLPYAFEHKDRWRKVPVPSPGRQSSRDRSFSFAYGDYGATQEIYSRLDDVYHRRDSTLPIYDDLRGTRRKPRIGLSNYGHLKIDYSYSWNKLDKYIYN